MHKSTPNSQGKKKIKREEERDRNPLKGNRLIKWGKTGQEKKRGTGEKFSKGKSKKTPQGLIGPWFSRPVCSPGGGGSFPTNRTKKGRKKKKGSKPRGMQKKGRGNHTTFRDGGEKSYDGKRPRTGTKKGFWSMGRPTRHPYERPGGWRRRERGESPNWGKE